MSRCYICCHDSLNGSSIPSSYALLLTTCSQSSDAFLLSRPRPDDLLLANFSIMEFTYSRFSPSSGLSWTAAHIRSKFESSLGYFVSSRTAFCYKWLVRFSCIEWEDLRWLLLFLSFGYTGSCTSSKILLSSKPKLSSMISFSKSTGLSYSYTLKVVDANGLSPRSVSW